MAKVPTVEMNHPEAGDIVCNDNPTEVDGWRARGFTFKDEEREAAAQAQSGVTPAKGKKGKKAKKSEAEEPTEPTAGDGEGGETEPKE